MTIASSRFHDNCQQSIAWQLHLRQAGHESLTLSIRCNRPSLYILPYFNSTKQIFTAFVCIDPALSIDYFPFPVRLISAAHSLSWPSAFIALPCFSGLDMELELETATNECERFFSSSSSSVLFLSFVCINTTLYLTSMRRRRAARSRCTRTFALNCSHKYSIGSVHGSSG